jgi:hypothetical protein
VKRKVILIAVAIIAIVMSTAAKCPAATPKIQESLCTDSTCAVVYNDKDDRKLLVYVEKAKFGNCEPGKRWPNCAEGDISRGMRNIPYNANPDLDKQEGTKGGSKDAKAVCVSSVSHPEAMITNTWFIGDMDARTEPSAIQGIFQKCNIGVPTQTAYIKSEHHAVPSTLMCNVFWVTPEGERIVLDFVITQALGDCVAQAVVP